MDDLRPRRRRCHKSSNQNMQMAADQISDLPLRIIHHIMSFLPTEDVIKSSCLSKTFYHASLDRRIDGAIRFAIDNHVKKPVLDLGSSKHYRFPPTFASANSITTLEVEGIKLNFHDLIRGFPLIEHLSILFCSGLEDVDIKIMRGKFRKIDFKYCVELKSLEIELPSLQCFEYSTELSQPCKIKIANCRALKVLSLSGATITDKWLGDHLWELVWLEN